ncbi:MAG: tRNA (N6-isopentenyl adenosine(37)-C2)-methylthiotransferase MiaB [Chitinivibrionales bacterium]|nr:tRNA (N6-isopentenyl adenosine(37)-C2)-methylthiotransferase MiaB [Chitinivibrionales bacterium]
MPTFYFQTFGCQMNVADSDLLAELLYRRGFRKAASHNDADLVVVNTCSVRHHAEQRALTRIREISKNKAAKKQVLWIIGCMAERLGESLEREIPGIDRVIGAKEIEHIDKTLDSYLRNCGAEEIVDPGTKPATTFIPVMRGCDNYCSYCIVPFVRGREHSVPANVVEERVKHAVEGGAKEVTLLGQNVNSYDDGACDFPDLCVRIHAVDKLKRIRFTTSHPKDCSEKLIKTIADLPKMCRHIHLPVQSGSTRILGLMNRKYTRDDYLRRINLIRKHIPGADITTDAMVGFPGETIDDFRETLSLFEEVRFTAAFMFAYSKRDQTQAAAMKETCTEKEKKARLSELIECQTGITRAYYDSMRGKNVQVLITERQKKKDRYWMGRDFGCRNVLVPCKRDISGTILNVGIAKSTGMTLVAERI